MVENHIVLGLNFGDEAKGSRVHHLADSESLVIRFSGGHQVGHTVELPDGKRHVFSHFGSGTFKGADTFWSKFCTFYPTGMLREREKLIELGVTPKIYIDVLSPVTTPYDVLFNQGLENSRARRHGSVGVGVGHTFERHDTTPFKLYAKDLLSPSILRDKLSSIEAYYSNKAQDAGFNLYEKEGTVLDERDVRNVFLGAVEYAVEVIQLRDTEFIRGYQKRIFEGSQGILLDQDHGVCFPHVTRAHTTSRNAVLLFRENHQRTTVHYMTRCYLTRHGRGPLAHEMKKEDMLQYFKNLDDRTNVPNTWQETLRYAPLNIEYMRHAILSNIAEHKNAGEGYPDQVICVSCTDQLKDENKIPFYHKGSDTIDLADVNHISDSIMNTIVPGYRYYAKMEVSTSGIWSEVKR